MATTLKEILDRLRPEDRSALNYAFKHEVPHYVLLDNGTKFIGVNVEHIGFFEPDFALSRGKWRTGGIKK